MMLYSTHSQALQLPLIMLTGMAMGAISLCFRGVRRLVCAGFWLSLLCDILMGTLWGAVFCVGVAIADNGKLRLFHIVSALCGAALFHAAFTVPAGKLFSRISRHFAHTCRYLSKNRLLRAIFK